MLKDDYHKTIALISAEIQKEITSENIHCDIPLMDEPDKINWQFKIRPLDIEDASSIRSQDEIQILKNSEVHYYRPMTSYFRFVQPIVIFVKRVIRKLVRFIGEPMVLEINQNRLYAVAAMESMQTEIIDLDQRMEKFQDLIKQYNDLYGQIENLRKENMYLRKRLLGANGIKA